MLVLALAPFPLASAAQTAPDADIRAVTEIISNHSVGGVALDLVGNLYVADFGEIVFKITPAGERTIFVIVVFHLILRIRSQRFQYVAGALNLRMSS